MDTEFIKPYTRFFEEENNEYLLTEKTYNVKQDVDYLYNRFFKQLCEDMKNDKLFNIESYKDDSYEEAKKISTFTSHKDILLGYIHSSELKSIDCIKANESIPVPIFFGIIEEGNHYNFSIKKQRYIFMGPNSFIANTIISSGLQNLFKIIPPASEKRARNEIEEFRIKASMSHELSHWIDDAYHDIFHKIIGDENSSPKEIMKRLKLNKKSVDATYFEIQGQIHGIEQLKNAYKGSWDEITLNKLLDLYPSLHHIALTLYKLDEDEFKQWSKDLVSRLHRENLLGKNMRLPIDIQKLMYEKVYRI